ncbi:MAG TPA: hypothetical protein PKM69_01600 [Bacteroidales bacterium]|nr:hypothetical protein [Bacteroidales bacterium]
MALLFFCVPVYPQNQTNNDTIKRVTPVTFVNTSDSISFIPNDTSSGRHTFEKPENVLVKNKNETFLDSLKVKASKYIITKKLYDIVVVTPDSTDNKHITGTSDANYISHSGKKIRNVEIQKINVFGTNINNPSAGDNRNINNLLNKTHINTQESIIRKNLLFSAGDTISPLTLSDNERILRQLSFIDDARIIVVPVSDDEVDIVVLTKDVYSLGGSYSYSSLKKGSVSVYDRNIVGIGHELQLEMPYDSELPHSPGFGAHYYVDNIKKSFINLNVFYLNAMADKAYGFSMVRNLVSAKTKYGGGISVKRMYTTENLDNTLPVPEPYSYNLQDYYLQRSFLINEESVSRIIIGARYTNNNVFNRPFILPNSYYQLQNYKLYLASAALSVQKFYKTNLIYNYGRTEDIPYGGLFKVTVGNENSEFKKRTYLGADFSIGKSSKKLGYFYSSAGLSTFINGNTTEQGLISFNVKYFSNLFNVGNNMIRNFVNVSYTRGFDRTSEELLSFKDDNGFSGFKNDSIGGKQRLSLDFESVVFSSLKLYGFKFAFFCFADLTLLSETNQCIGNGQSLKGLGLGVRIRNDNLVFNTFQIRIGFFPNSPSYSSVNHFVVSGEQLLSPNNFDAGPPTVMPFI